MTPIDDSRAVGNITFVTNKLSDFFIELVCGFRLSNFGLSGKSHTGSLKLCD